MNIRSLSAIWEQAFTYSVLAPKRLHAEMFRYKPIN